MQRIDNRKNNQLRPLSFETNYILYPEGSVLACAGNTKVLCNASVEDGAPRWMQAQDKPGGWITGEYSMLPRSTHTRNRRETKGPRGRTQEISRLIGRSLRAGFDLEKLTETTITIDCDVLQADGGTRTLAISGGYLATRLAVNKLISDGKVNSDVIKPAVAAISVGMIGDSALLDLCYEEDVAADVNVVMNSNAEFIEVQGTAEGQTISKPALDELLSLAESGIKDIFTSFYSII